MAFKVGQRIYVDWPGVGRAYGRVCRAEELGAQLSSDKDELWIKWDGERGGCVHLALLQADVKLNGTKIKVVRTYTRPYVGTKQVGRPGFFRNVREVFRSATTPTEKSHPHYGVVIGPFKTTRGADYMARYGAHTGNPHCRTVADAERLSAEVEAKHAEKSL